MNEKPLTPFEQWMVRSNLTTITESCVSTAQVVTMLRNNGYKRVAAAVVKARLAAMRTELRAERISYGELAELQDLADEIEPGDVELAEAAGIPDAEFARRGV